MKHSIRTKIGLLLLFMALILGFSLTLVSSLILRKAIDDLYKSKTSEVASVLAAVMDPGEVEALTDSVMEIYQNSEKKVTSQEWGSDDFNAYVEQFTPIYDTPEYAAVLEDMKNVQDNSNVDCVYLFATDFSNERPYYIYIIDAAEEDACPVGTIDSYDWGIEQGQLMQQHPELEYGPYITRTDEYGWLVSTMVPVFGEDEELLLYSCVDISMNTVRTAQNSFTLLLIGISVAIFVVLILIGVRIVNSNIVIPVKTLSSTAENYWASGESGVRNDFKNLHISTNDEIEILSESMKKMESDINDYFLKLDAAEHELTSAKEESEAMKELAQRDALTGIRNKTAYDKEIEEVDLAFQSGELGSYGIAMVDLNYLKRINDTYGHDKGNIAIKKVCKVVCEVFTHSPVFRIGGDEFVVVLKNNDLANIETLLGEFRKRISAETNNESLDMWERISAAIGYAVYDPAIDQAPADVFKRADEEMYKDKQRQKAERKD